MKAESDVVGHKWWHNCRPFLKRMGHWSEQGAGEKGQVMCLLTRWVFYCRICRQEFHEGEPMFASIREALDRGKPKLEPAPPIALFQDGSISKSKGETGFLHEKLIQDVVRSRPDFQVQREDIGLQAWPPPEEDDTKPKG